MQNIQELQSSKTATEYIENNRSTNQVNKQVLNNLRTIASIRKIQLKQYRDRITQEQSMDTLNALVENYTGRFNSIKC
jgi:uncharacterized protein YhbP (UPF0306 family)